MKNNLNPDNDRKPLETSVNESACQVGADIDIDGTQFEEAIKLDGLYKTLLLPAVFGLLVIVGVIFFLLYY